VLRTSIVPLKLGESVVDSQDAFQKASGFEGDVVFIFNHDRTQLSETSPNVSYDLRVGSEYRDHHDAEKTELPDDGELVLHLAMRSSFSLRKQYSCLERVSATWPRAKKRIEANKTILTLLVSPPTFGTSVPQYFVLCNSR
jgi:hypothetical protein